MKYAVAYKTGSDNWVFMKFGPSKDFPLGLFGCGMRKFDNFETADAVRINIVALAELDVGGHFNRNPDTLKWAASLRVVEIPDAALAKFDDARRLTDECTAHPRDNVPEGSRENQLFHRGREIGDIGREGWRIFMEHLTRTATR
jgi:hypothetical protein